MFEFCKWAAEGGTASRAPISFSEEFQPDCDWLGIQSSHQFLRIQGYNCQTGRQRGSGQAPSTVAVESAELSMHEK